MENVADRDRIAAAPKTGRAALWFVLAVVVLDLIGMTLLMPVQAYIVRRYSSDALMVTMMTVIYAAASFVAAPVLGKLSDRYGRRPVLLISVLGSAVGYYLFGVGGALWVLFTSRLIDGLTGGNISTAAAYIADITPPAERARNFALIGAAYGFGFILGPALGGVLSQVSLTAPAYAAGTASLLAAGFGFFVLPESLPAEKRLQARLRWSDLNTLAPIGELLRRPALGVPLVVQCIFNFAVMGFNSVAAVYLIDKFHVPALDIGALLLVVGVANVVVQGTLVGRLAQALGEKKLAIVGLLFEAVEMVGTVIVPRYWMQYLVQGFSSGGSGPFRPALSAMLANNVPAEEQGKLSGVSTALNSLMSVFGPLWAGAAYDRILPAAPFWSGMALIVVAALLLVRVKAPAVQQPVAEQPAATR